MGIIFHGLRLNKLQQMQASEYPHIPVGQFERWKRLEIMSIYLCFLAFASLAAMMGMLKLFLPSEGAQSTHGYQSPQMRNDSGIIILVMGVVGGGFGAFLILLIVAAVMGSMAAGLRKKYNINLNIFDEKKNGISTFPQNTFPQAMPPPAPAPYRAPTGPVYRSKSSAFSSIDWRNAGPNLIVIAVVIGLGISAMIYWTQRSSTQRSSATPPKPQSVREAGTTSPYPSPMYKSPGTSKRVMALYYPWYQTKSYSHRWAHQSGIDSQHRRMATHTHYPVQGPYDSADPAVIDRHLNQAEEAGIDTLVCSWWGPQDPTDKSIRLLLARAARTKIKVCVLWEQLTPPASADTAESDLAYIVKTFGGQPASLRLNNKPVVFAFEGVCNRVDPAMWPQIRNAIDARFTPGVLVLGIGLLDSQAALWDGQYILGADSKQIGASPAALARAQHQEYEKTLWLARQTGRITVVSVEPGYDDRKPNAAMGLPRHTVTTRQNGKLYSALWQQALADDPDWILVNSFNQWHAGTEIEPSVEIGDTYLKLTRKFARRFKGQADPTSSSDWSIP